MMHRYWAYLYKDEFKSDQKFEDDFHKSSIIKAMDIVDRQLGTYKVSINLNIISSLQLVWDKKLEFNFFQ